MMRRRPEPAWVVELGGIHHEETNGMLRDRLHLLLILGLGLTLVTGCTARSGGGGGDDDDDNNELAFGGLDTDDDGSLTDSDVDSGEAAIFWLTVVDGDEDSATESAETDSDASLTNGDGVWGVRFSTGGDLALTVSIYFENPVADSSDLGVGTGSLAWVNASTSNEDLLVWASESSGNVTISSYADGEASGFFEGVVELTIASGNEQPTGEVVRIEAFAFNAISLPAN